ncbi:MAG: acetylglutamate kinase [Clostridiales bacterium]|nr:acetylglutamate kinase [Clostridiales bacterium]
MVDQKYLEKAEVLIEALPYIRRFHDKIIVVKYGGSAMIDEELKREVIQDVVLLKLVGFKPIIVHGGGKEISRWVDKAGKETEFVGGLRVTDKETIEIAQMVLGKVNKDLVANVQTLGVQAAGISGMDGGMLKVEKKYVDGRDIGYVGDIKSVDTKILQDLMEQDFLPIVYPIGLDENGDAYNINADEAASAIATALKAEKLAYLSDVEGVRMDPEDPASVISELYVDEAEKLVEEGVIQGGMLPKIRNCIEALKDGVSRIHIMDGRIPHSLLLEFFTNKGIGTAIIQESEEKYWNE